MRDTKTETNDVKRDLLAYYNQTAAVRDERRIADWKAAERGRFLALLQAEGKQRLLEIGAGPGRDGLFFQENGLAVVCTDLSPQMVALCRQKNLSAHVMDFYHLDFPPAAFDAVFAFNCLLHVPKPDLPQVLAQIQRVLRPGGLFYFSAYGGKEHDGVWRDDPHEPKRYFSFYPDEQIQQVVRPFFTPVSFRVVKLENVDDHHFQSMIWRRPQPQSDLDDPNPVESDAKNVQ